MTVTITNTTTVTTVRWLTASPLTFTVSNWDTLQDVTVTPVNDNINQSAGSDLTTTVTHAASGSDYGGITVDLTVTVVDNDTGRMALSFEGVGG